MANCHFGPFFFLESQLPIEWGIHHSPPPFTPFKWCLLAKLLRREGLAPPNPLAPEHSWPQETFLGIAAQICCSCIIFRALMSGPISLSWSIEGTEGNKLSDGGGLLLVGVQPHSNLGQSQIDDEIGISLNENAECQGV